MANKAGFDAVKQAIAQRSAQTVQGNPQVNAPGQAPQVDPASQGQAVVAKLEQKLGGIEKEDPNKATAKSDDMDIHALAFGLMLLVPMVEEMAQRLVVVEHVLARALGHNPAPVQNVPIPQGAQQAGAPQGGAPQRPMPPQAPQQIPPQQNQ